jgi:hypothetical protein
LILTSLIFSLIGASSMFASLLLPYAQSITSFKSPMTCT